MAERKSAGTLGRLHSETKLKNTERLREKAEKEHAIYLEEIQKRGISKTTHDYHSPLARKREILKHKQKQ